MRKGEAQGLRGEAPEIMEFLDVPMQSVGLDMLMGLNNDLGMSPLSGPGIGNMLKSSGPSGLLGGPSMSMFSL